MGRPRCGFGASRGSDGSAENGEKAQAIGLGPICSLWGVVSEYRYISCLSLVTIVSWLFERGLEAYPSSWEDLDPYKGLRSVAEIGVGDQL